MALISIGRLVGATGTIAIAESTFPQQWASQKEEYAKLRGFDVGRDSKKLPLINNSEARALTEYWDDQGEGSDQTHADAALWRMFATHVDVLTAGKPAGEVFDKLQFFWDGLQKRATSLASTSAIPSRWAMLSESVSEAIDELPDRARDVAAFLWPEWATTALKWGGIGLGGALGIYWIAKSRK